jgi:hypothetical protein
MDVWKKLEVVQHTFRGLPDYKERMNQNWKSILSLTISLAQACAYKYAGQGLYAEE